MAEKAAMKSQIETDVLQNYQANLSDFLTDGPNSIANTTRTEVLMMLDSLRSDLAEELKSFSLSAQGSASVQATLKKLEMLMQMIKWIERHGKTLAITMVVVALLIPISTFLTGWKVYNVLKHEHSALQQENLTLTRENVKSRQEKEDILEELTEASGGRIRKHPKYGILVRVKKNTPLQASDEPGSTFYPLK
jgi:hypothetical protein